MVARLAIRHAVTASFIVLGLLGSSAQGQPFLRGDANDDFATNLADSVYLASYLYSGGPAPAPVIDSGDANDNGLPEISDIPAILSFVFLGGTAPPAPFPFPGPDPTPNVFDPPVEPGIELTFDALTTVAGAAGLELDLRLSNTMPVEAVEVAVTVDPTVLEVVQWDLGGSVLGSEGAEFIVNDVSGVDGFAWLAAVVDFATPITGQVIDPGMDELLATLIFDVDPFALPQLSGVSLEDVVAVSPTKRNLASINGGTAVIPTLTDGVVQILLTFIRGDANRDDQLDISDVIFTLEYIFVMGPVPTCEDAADTNNDGHIDIADTIYLLNYLFVFGPTPSEPFPLPGLDPDIDDLGCDA